MKSIFKIFMSAGILTLALGMVGCGNDKKTTQQAPTPPTDDRPVIRVVTDGESPPMSFVDEHGNLQGIDIDVIRAIGESQGFKVDLRRDLFHNIFSGLDVGKYHLAISSLSLTPERADRYSYSDSYLHNPAIIVHNQPTELSHIDMLKPLRVATTKGTMFTPIAEALDPAEHRINTTNFQNYQGLLQGNIDAIMGDKYVLEYMMIRHPLKTLKSFEYQIGDGSSAKMVIYGRKNNPELIDKLNKGISELQQSGKMDIIIQKYLKNANSSSR